MPWTKSLMMVIRHLQYLTALARERHFARAAAVCNVTQPTLSAGIKQLEESLGVLIVERGQRFLGLTIEGERVLAGAQRVLVDYGSLQQELSEMREGLVGQLRIGAIPVTLPIVPLLTGPFAKRHERTDIQVVSLNSISIQRGLDEFSLDVGVTYLDNEPLENVRRVHLYRERYVFVADRRHRFAGRAAITWAEAAAERLCLLSEDMQNRRIMDKVAASVGVRIKPAVVSNSFLAVCAHVRHGEWSSIVPHNFFYVFGQAPDLAAIDLIDPVHAQTVGLVMSDRDPPSPMAGALLAALKDVDIDAELDAAMRPV